MKHIASLSYGKDSIAMLEIIKRHDMPLDRIIHVEIMATKTIPADLPPMVEFKAKADKIIKERYGIVVEHIQAPFSYQEYFYKKAVKGKYCGNIHGFPMAYKRAAWCNKRLKIEPLLKVQKGNIAYVGIAVDEPNRFGNLSADIVSPLVEHDVTEAECRRICEELNLLSPIYTQASRGGVGFATIKACNN